MAGTVQAGQSEIAVIRPFKDHHDRLSEIAHRVRPLLTVHEQPMERRGGRTSTEWDPSFGSSGRVALGELQWVALENAPMSGLQRLRDENDQPLDAALVDWVRRGGRLLVVGGGSAFSSYKGTALESILPVTPLAEDGFGIRRQRSLTTGSESVWHLHQIAGSTGRVRLRAGGKPLVVEGTAGAGRVVVVLAGTQGQLGPDGRDEEWFASASWEAFVADEIAQAIGTPVSLTPKETVKRATSIRLDSFDIRYFAIGNHPYPFSLAAGEAGRQARQLAEAGFTSVVFKANPNRPKDDERALREIASAGLPVIYYESLLRNSGRHVFRGLAPATAQLIQSEGKAWDIHDEAFRAEVDQLLTQRDVLAEIPLRGLQLIEEFQDGAMRSPSLSGRLARDGLSGEVLPGETGWWDHERIRADETRKTFARFRAAGKRRFPLLPQSSYWPGSYWHRPQRYTWRLADLADTIDELMPPGYGYGSGALRAGRLSVQRGASEAFAGLGHRLQPGRHLAVYALGRPFRPGGPAPDLATWRETTWTSLAHGASGLAYWAAPIGPITKGLAPLHNELARLGPWLEGVSRKPAPVLLLESWTSRSAGPWKRSKHLSMCLQRVADALALGFEEVGMIFEERMSQIPDSAQALVVVSSPELDAGAVPAIRSFLARGGHLIMDGQSAKRTHPGARPIEKSALGPADRIHSVPLGGGCLGSRSTPEISATAWRKVLARLGIQARISTEDLDTSATLRGDREVAHLYFLNHRLEPTPVVARLREAAGDLRWTNLRTGEAQKVDGVVASTSSPVPARDAEVWIGVARPAAKLNVRHVHDGWETDVVDQAGIAVANGYPLEGRFRSGKWRSVVVRNGRASFGSRKGDTLSAVRDPVTGLEFSVEKGQER